MKIVIKYLTFFILFTVLTKTYVFWASLLHVEVSVITSIVFMVSIFILIFELTTTKIIFPKRWVTPLFIFLIIAPFTTLILTQYFNISSLLLQFFYFVVFLLTYVYFKKYGRDLLFLLFLLSLLFTIIFGFVSVVDSTFFAEYGNIVDSLIEYGGRAFGFYLQPNSLALAIILMYIGIIVLDFDTKYIIYLYPLIFTMILFTGSRSSFVAFVILSLFLLFFLLKKYKRELLLSVIILIPITLFTYNISSEYLTKTFQDDRYKDLLTRIDSMLGKDNDAIKNDIDRGSLDERLYLQKHYQKLILKAPIIGYGIGIQNDLMRQKILKGSSHNTIYEIVLQGGLIYFLFFIFYMTTLFINYIYMKRENIVDKRVLLGYKLFLFIMIFYFLFDNTFFNDRLVYMVLAIFAVFSMENQKMIEGS